MRIQHNIAALNSYRNLTANNSAVSKNLEKLSSGYRINRAGDDAAGLAISEKMRAQITGLETAQDNANDGISLIQTAEGALTEVHSMLNRMVELADQSANGTYQDEDRANLQSEIQALKDEIDRISEGTNFNGINLLDGSLDGNNVANSENVTVTQILDGDLGKTAQAGKFSINFTNTTITSTGTSPVEFKIFEQTLKLDALVSGTSMSGAALATAIADAWNTGDAASKSFNGVTMTAKVSGDSVIFEMDKAPTSAWSTTAGSIAEQTGNFTNTTMTTQSKGTSGNQGEQVVVTVLREPVSSDQGRLYAQSYFELDDTLVADGKTLTIGDTTYTFAVGKNSQYTGSSNVIDLTDLEQEDIADNLGVAAQRLSYVARNNSNFKVGTDTVSGKITLTEKEGGVDYTEHDLAGTKASVTDGDWAGLVKTGTRAGATSSALTLQIGDTADAYNQLSVSVASMSADSLGIGEIDISTQAGAKAAVDKIKAAINTVSSTRGDLGALQNRLEHTINNLSVTTENMTAAESRIRDVDMAEEMMAYTKNNILVQASQAMLAQANQIPQGVLQLLQ